MIDIDNKIQLMETFETIKKFLNDGGKCLLIENDKPIGVILTISEYEKLKNGKTAELPFSEPKETPAAKNPIGEAMAKEIDYPEVSADLADIEATDDVTLEDLGVDELPY